MRKRTGIFIVSLVVVVIGLVFASTGPAAWATPDQSPLLQTVPTPVPGGTVAEITGTGGTVTSPDASVSVAVPAGATAIWINVAYTPRQATELPGTAPSGFSFLGRAFTLDVFEGLTPQPGFTFTQAVTICVNATAADVAAVGGNPTKLQIMRYSDALGAWVGLPTTVDLVTLKACATVRQFSWFALGGPVVATPTPTPVLKPGDDYISRSGMWLGLAVVGLMLVAFGGFTLRRTRTS